MSRYIHELHDWPSFTWDSAHLSDKLARVRHRQGRILGRMESLGFSLRQEASLESLTEEVQKSSEIEGENLNRDDVRSSIARRLGMDVGGLAPGDRNVEGVVEMVMNATREYAAPLTKKRLYAWHASLFPSTFSGMRKIQSGKWRDDRLGPMQVVSGPLDRERVHFQAPPASRVNDEMERFLSWFEREETIDPVLKAGLAHLWFVTIHPFDDGNGRIARAITDMTLARCEESSERYYSMSAQIRAERNTYYEVLERVQKGTMDITRWMEWFLGCLDRAFERADGTLQIVLAKARFWDKHRSESFNERQRSLLNILLDGFRGNLTTSRCAKIAKCSQDTAYRDITDLVTRGVLQKDPPGGRSTSYSLRFGRRVI